MPPRSIPAAQSSTTVTGRPSRRLIGLGVALLVLIAAFSEPLVHLVYFSLGNDLYSYIPLIPLVSGYLIWIQRGQLPPASAPAWRLAILPAVLGLGLSAVAWEAFHANWNLDPSESLALETLAFVAFVWAACGIFVGARTVRTLAFPLLFLAFTTPLPAPARAWFESFLQQASANVADGLFTGSFTTYWRNGLFFHLPDITLEVAPECSGIHSTIVLFITSFLAAYLFLRTGWRQAVLVAAVLPLALLRNGFRIFVIGQLCIHIGPEMINSYIHHHGGPIFFLLSLVPFFYLLRWLRRSEPSPASPP